MKKIVVLIYLTLLLGCGSGITRADFPKLIIGEWKAVSFGDNYAAMNISLPAAFQFRNDKTYTQTFTENGKNKIMQGNYFFTENRFVYQIDLLQKNPVEARILGIITFANENEMTLKLANGFINKRPSADNTGDEQTYRRVN